MTLYSCEVLRVDALGNVAISFLTVDDDDTNLESQDAFATYSVDGLALAAAPILHFGDISGLAPDGSVVSTPMVQFNAGGFDYYLLNSDVAPQEFASFTSVSIAGTVGGFFDLNKSLTLDHEKLYTGQALRVVFDNTAGATGIGVEDVFVSDDDARIQFNGLNGAPDSEAGVDAQIVLGSDRSVEGFNTTNAGAGDTQMVLVEVTCQTGTGTVTFEALRFTFPIFNGSFVYYMPRANSVDLSTVVAYLDETLIGTSLNGVNYAEFGLNGNLRVTAGNAADDYLHGSMLHDQLQGQGGNDTLIGGLGADSLIGANGADDLYGGGHKDTLGGGDGADTLSGGIDDDRLSGDAGADRLLGGFGDDQLNGGASGDVLLGDQGNDVLTGAAGADTLTGGTGNDVLDGGTGRDELRGNAGSDRFVFAVDGATDKILDFQNGVDVIDLAEAFATLTITTLAPGSVQITHSGEVILVTDAAGTLTAADLTAADFV